MNAQTISKSIGWTNIVKLIIPYLFIGGLLQLFAYKLLGLSFKNSNINTVTSVQALFIEFISTIGTVGVVWLFRKKVDKKSFSTIGFKNINICFNSIWGIFLGFSFMTFVFFLLLFTDQIYLKSLNFQLTDICAYFILFLLVAVSEEILIRGYILSNLMASFNTTVAVIISSVLFSIMHIANDNISAIGLIELFIFGIIFALGYIYSKGLWFPIALHFSWNFFQGPIFGFKVSGIQVNSLIKLEIKNPNIWNGGDFGIEGSILSIVFILLAIVFFKSILIPKTKSTTF